MIAPLLLFFRGLGLKWIGLTALVLVLAAQHVEIGTLRARLIEQRLVYSQTVDAAGRAAQEANQEYRAKEAQWKEEQDATVAQALESITRAEAAAAAASSAAGRLRTRFAAAVAASHPACPNSPAPAERAPTDPTPDVLTDVLGRVNEAAGQLAAYAEESRIAGLACEQSYDSLNKEDK